MWTLENSLYKLDILEWPNTKDRINDLLDKPCISTELTPTEIMQIATEARVDLLKEKIDAECKNWEVISIDVLNNTLKAIQTVHDDVSYHAALTTSKIMWIDSTWIYSDWIKENAPFDLIIDLQKIDEVVFASEWENWWYQKAKYFDVWKSVNDSLAKKWYLWNNDYFVWLKNNQYYNELEEYISENAKDSSNQYMCPINSSSDSWLTDDDINEILWKDSSLTTWTSSSWWNYEKVNDNSQFPCTEFFCIQIDFTTHQSWMDLSWWLLSWGQNISIEWIINRSNDHLKQFSWTSLIWAEMTTNNFELGLQNLNLAESFHMWFQMYYKPAPLLNVNHKKEEEKKDDKSEAGDKKVWKDTWPFSVDQLLRFYYDSYGLNFRQRNDLSLLKKYEVDKQIIINTSLMTPTYVAWKFEEYDEYQKRKAYQREEMRRLIQNKTQVEMIWDFEEQFKELEIFNKSIRDYVVNLEAIISKMNEIPVDSWRS